jgi:hypothetical protein
MNLLIIPCITAYISYFTFICWYIYANTTNSFFFNYHTKDIFWNIYFFFNKSWLFDNIYNLYIVKNILKIGFKYTQRYIDKGILECYGPNGIISFFFFFSKHLNQIYKNSLYLYICYMIYIIMTILIIYELYYIYNFFLF